MLLRVMMIGLITIAGLIAPSVATAKESASIATPSSVKQGQQVDAEVRCAKNDKHAALHVKRAFVSLSRDVKLTNGRAHHRISIPDHTPTGEYTVSLKCRPSGASSSKTVTVTG